MKESFSSCVVVFGCQARIRFNGGECIDFSDGPKEKNGGSPLRHSLVGSVSTHWSRLWSLSWRTMGCWPDFVFLHMLVCVLHARCRSLQLAIAEMVSCSPLWTPHPCVSLTKIPFQDLYWVSRQQFEVLSPCDLTSSAGCVYSDGHVPRVLYRVYLDVLICDWDCWQVPHSISSWGALAWALRSLHDAERDTLSASRWKVPEKLLHFRVLFWRLFPLVDVVALFHIPQNKERRRRRVKIDAMTSKKKRRKKKKKRKKWNIYTICGSRITQAINYCESV